MRNSHRPRGERGQSLVELAISLTMILLLLSGAVDFGMALFSYVAIRDAAQEGALYGSLNPYADSNKNGQYDAGEPVNAVGIRQRVRATSTNPVRLPALTDSQIDVQAVGAPCEGLTGGASNGVQVTVYYDYPTIMPFIGPIIGGRTIHLHASVTDTILQPRCPKP